MRYGIRLADDPLIVDSLKVVDHVLKIETPYGPCWRRYNHDGYGQQKNGDPFIHYGQGRAWPILTGERAHYELAAGADVRPLVRAMERFSSVGGMLPEQVWDYRDVPEKGLFFGQSAGSAQPLVWAHAEYTKLLRSCVDGAVFDRISVVEKRYGVRQHRRKFTSDAEFFQVTRPISRMRPGKRLQVLDRSRFEVVWSLDDWLTRNVTDSTLLTDIGFCAALPVLEEGGKVLEISLHWLDENRWSGANYRIVIE